MTPSAPFRLGLVSDLHLETAPDFLLDTTNLDVLIAAGDILSGSVEHSTGVDYLAQMAPNIPTLYVPGNHEFEGSSIDQAISRLRKQAKGTQVKVLYRDAVDLYGVRFLGVTLWSGFDLFGENNRSRCQREAQKHLQDFKTILSRNGRPFTPAMVREEHVKDVAWLIKQLAKDPHIPKILVTHFAPATGSLLRHYGNDPLSAYWVNPCEDLVKQALLSVHGHVHASFDYRLTAAPVGRGRVVANAKGFDYIARRSDVPAENLPALIEQLPALATQEEVEVRENPDFANPLRLQIDPATGQVDRIG